MWTCSTLSLVRESSNTAPSTSPRVSHDPLSVVSEKATPLSRQCRSCSSTQWEREATQPRRPATCSCKFKASRDFIILSLDGSRAVEDHLEEGQHATVLSIVDHYMQRPDSPHFNTITLLEFARQYSMPKILGAEPSRRTRRIVVIPRPYVSSDPAGDKYEQYCCHSLMQYQPFRQMDDLLSGYDNYIDAYAAFMQSGHILEDDMYHLLQLSQSTEADTEDTEVSLYAWCSCVTHKCSIEKLQ